MPRAGAQGLHPQPPERLDRQVPPSQCPAMGRRVCTKLRWVRIGMKVASQCPAMGRRVCTLLLIVAILSTFSVSMPRDGAQGLHHK